MPAEESGGKAGRTGVAGTREERPAGERERSLEVWLESIDDDPAELLRALFRQQLEKGRP